MRSKTLQLMLIMAMPVATQPAEAGQREKIQTQLEHVHQRIEALESHDLHVPEDLRRMERELQEGLEHLAEREFVADHALDMLDDISPGQAQRLRELREQNGDEFFEVLGDIMPWLEEMQELRQEHPERFELERKSHDLNFACEFLAEKARGADPGERENLSKDLRKRLAELFELRLKMRRMQIERLEAELAEARTQVENMNTRRDQMIQRRLDQLLNADDNW